MSLDDRLDLIPGDWRIYFEPTKEAKQAILSDLKSLADNDGNIQVKDVEKYCGVQ